MQPQKSLGPELTSDIAYDAFDARLTERKTRVAIKFASRDGAIVARALADVRVARRAVAAVLGVKARRVREHRRAVDLSTDDRLDDFKEEIDGCVMTTMPADELRRRVDATGEFDELRIADARCVRVTDSRTDASRCVPVQVFDRTVDKPSLGGYRHVGTGAESHHAFSQTGPRPPKVGIDKLNHRDTQTAHIRHQRTEMPYSRAQQMYREDLYVPSITDKIITAKPYENSEDRAHRLSRLEKIKTIQRYFRAWKLRKSLHAHSAEYRLRERKAQEEVDADAGEGRSRERRDLITKAFPKTRYDFGMMYAIAERWKRRETSRIGATYCGAAKIAELAILLDRELDVFRAIDRIHQGVKAENRRVRDASYLTRLGEPLKWYCPYKYLTVELDSKENQRARELDALYQRLLAPKADLSALLDLRLALRGDDCEVAIDLSRLVERAIELLARGFNDARLAPTMKRVRATALHHFKQRECYSGLTAHDDAARRKFMRRNLFVCVRCSRMKTADEFALRARSTRVAVCRSCAWLDRTAEPWAELSPYREMLKRVRRAERAAGSASSVAFVLRDRDAQHLVEQIWHAHSAISESKELFGLRLCRWERERDWSPWNCILLTKEEAKSHSKIENLEEVYEKEFLDHVYNKHALAKKHFEDLVNIENKFKSLYKVSSFENLNTKSYVDYRKMFPVKKGSRLFF